MCGRNSAGTESIVYTRFSDGVKYMEFTEAVARSIQANLPVLKLNA